MSELKKRIIVATSLIVIAIAPYLLGLHLFYEEEDMVIKYMLGAIVEIISIAMFMVFFIAGKLIYNLLDN